MTLIVETGEGVENANSYASIAEADVYFTARNNETWLDLSDQEKELALISGTDYIHRHYVNNWVGTVLTSHQRLFWPRSDAYGKDRRLRSGVPNEIKEATYEASIRTLTDDLMPDRPANFGTLDSRSRKAGPVEVSESFKISSSQPTYYEIDGIVAVLMLGGRGTMKARRV